MLHVHKGFIECDLALNMPTSVHVLWDMLMKLCINYNLAVPGTLSVKCYIAKENR